MQINHKQVLSKLYPPISYNINGEHFLAQCEVMVMPLIAYNKKPMIC